MQKKQQMFIVSLEIIHNVHHDLALELVMKSIDYDHDHQNILLSNDVHLVIMSEYESVFEFANSPKEHRSIHQQSQYSYSL